MKRIKKYFCYLAEPPLPAGSKLCPDPNGRYRSSTNCSEFYVCAAGKPIKFYCPLGLVYSDVRIYSKKRGANAR